MVDTAQECQLTMRADRSSYIVFSVIWLPLIILDADLAIEAIIKHQNVLSLLTLLLLLVGAYGIFLFWLSAFKLIVDNGELSYKTLFSSEKRLSISEITRSQYMVGGDGIGKPFMRLELYGEKSNCDALLMINIKVFSRADLSKLQQLLQDSGVIFEDGPDEEDESIS